MLLPRRICPRCGSKETATILWGMPVMTQELQDKLDKKEVVLGGCRISTSAPTHHCNSCGKDFGGSYFAEPAFIKELYFYVGGYFGPCNWVYLHSEKFGKVLRYTTSNIYANDIESDLPNSNIFTIPIDNKWVEFNKDLLRCYFIDWEDSYVDMDILDGTQWKLTVTFDNGITIRRGGSNAYPPHWKKLIKTFHKYGLPKFW